MRKRKACPCPSGTKSRERRACPRSSSTRNQAGESSSVCYDVVRMECKSSFIRYKESSWREFIRPVRSCTIGGLVIVCLVRGINLARLRLSGTKSRERRACPRLSCTMNQAGGTSSIWFKFARKEGLTSSVQYKESSTRDFVRPVRSRANGELVLVCPVRGRK